MPARSVVVVTETTTFAPRSAELVIHVTLEVTWSDGETEVFTRTPRGSGVSARMILGLPEFVARARLERI